MKMASPTSEDFLVASAMAYAESFNNITLDGLPGQAESVDPSAAQWNILDYTTTAELQDGLYGVAYYSSQTDQAIIAFDGNIPSTTSSTQLFGPLLGLVRQVSPSQIPAFVDAETFAEQVAVYASDVNIPLNQIYVTGNSIGGTEAEYLATQLGLQGMTFGGSGLPGYSGTQLQPPVIDYVDTADPIANLASDTTQSTGALNNFAHAGRVIEEQSPIGGSVLELFGNELVNASTLLANPQALSLLSLTKLSKAVGQFVVHTDIDILLSKQYGSLTNYANDLHLQMPTLTFASALESSAGISMLDGPGSVVAASNGQLPNSDVGINSETVDPVAAALGLDPLEILESLDDQLGAAGDADLEQATVINADSAESPYYSVSIDTSGASPIVTVVQNAAISFVDDSEDLPLDPGTAVITLDATSGQPDIEAYTDTTTGLTTLFLPGGNASANAADLTIGEASDLVLIGDPTVYQGTILSFLAGGTIDMLGIGTATSATLGTNNMLTVTGGSSPITLNLGSTQYTTNSFLIAPDGSGGTEITAEDNTQPIAFTGISETLLVTNPANLTGAISAFAPGDIIDLAGIGTATGAVLGNNNILTVNESGDTSLLLQLDPSQTYAPNESFLTTSDGNGGSLITPYSVTMTAGVEPQIVNDAGEFLSNGTIYSASGSVINFNLPASASGGTVTAIGDNGIVAGQLSVVSGTPPSGQIYGFVDDAGEVTTFNGGIAGSFTIPIQVSSGGAVVGGYEYPLIQGQFFQLQAFGFLYDNGTFMVIDPTGASSAEAVGVNDNGDAVGWFTNNSGPRSGFLYSGGAYTSIDVPGSTSTSPVGIDDQGQIAGTYTDSAGTHGFVWTAGVYGTISAPAGSTGIDVIGIDEQGRVWGYYSGADGKGHAFAYYDGTLTPFLSEFTSVIPTAVSPAGDVVGTEITGGKEQGFVATTVQNVADQLSCFASGTKITTLRGDVSVEHLAIGDCVITSSRIPSLVKWIGHRRVNCARHPRPQAVWPVRISADAFGTGLPQKDLWLSPDHSVYVGDVLIPVKHLINGTTITQIPVDQVTYYHVELEEHDVLLAEGLPAESYLDTGDRSNFENDGKVMRLFPDFSSRALDTATLWETKACAPLLVHGPELEAARAVVNAQVPKITPAAVAA